jgi:excisionase family DNA binding protein
MSSEDNEIEWITTQEAAEIMGIHEESVRRLCRKGEIKARKFGISWMVGKKAAETYERDYGGRPKEK